MTEHIFTRMYMDNCIELIQEHLDDRDLVFDEEQCYILAEAIDRMEVVLPKNFYASMRENILNKIQEAIDSCDDAISQNVLDSINNSFEKIKDSTEQEVVEKDNSSVNTSDLTKQMIYDCYLLIWDFIYEQRYCDDEEYDYLSDKLCRLYRNIPDKITDVFSNYIANEMEPFTDYEDNEDLLEEKIASLNEDEKGASDFANLGLALEKEFQAYVMDKIYPYLVTI